LSFFDQLAAHSEVSDATKVLREQREVLRRGKGSDSAGAAEGGLGVIRPRAWPLGRRGTESHGPPGSRWSGL